LKTCQVFFILGDDILVALMVHPNVRKRDVYLPSGTWQDHWTKEIFTGSVLLKHYPAPLGTLPLFNRIG
jgi:alpha-glucosidase (family GH31 glycosyl hydrolase)